MSSQMKYNQLNITTITSYLKSLVNSDHILFQMPLISLNVRTKHVQKKKKKVKKDNPQNWQIEKKKKKKQINENRKPNELLR